MAYASVVSLAKTINLILNYHQHSISPQVKTLIISIHEYTILFQAFLEELADRANTLEGRIWEATHEVENMIENSLLQQMQKSTDGSKLKFQLNRSKKYEQIRYDLQQLKRVTEEIESIAEEVMEIKNSITISDVRRGDPIAVISSSNVAPIQKEAMIEFEKDMRDIQSKLCGESSKRQVVPIVGMGGIGKTTLARTVYETQLIAEIFEIRAWATVAQDYSALEIFKDLLVSMKAFDAKSKLSVDQHVHQTLIGRRYLIVLDDVWSTKAWDDLKMMFPDNCNGSRILLTTRLSDVATYMGSSCPVHEMNLMDEDQSWKLLQQKVFNRNPCPDGLQDVGRMIARSCKGLPLAVVVVSGLLVVDQTEAAWWKVAKDIHSAIYANDENLDRILSLSYKHLPHHLRPYFLYMGGFPEDYEMQASKLVKLWVAEGFLKVSVDHRSAEDTAEECLEDLVKRSLISVNKRRSNGRVKSFSIHDVMREMCIKKAREENFVLHVRGSHIRQGSKFPPRLSISYSDLSFFENYHGPTLHTIILLKHRTRSSSDILVRFRLLKTLDLSNAYEFFRYDAPFPYVPAQVFQLIHLEYLAFDFPFSIPAAISNLQKLQTLIIGPNNFDETTPLSWLPREIWKMPQLRHLIFYSRFLPFKDGESFALENLQTLSGAINLICFEKILERIPNLKKLRLVYKKWELYREVFLYEQGFQLHNLKHLQKLENLKLELDHTSFGYAHRKDNLAFPMTLKKLTLRGLGLPWEDMKIVGSLPNLEVLKLRDDACIGDTWKTTEGEFPKLIFLLIDQSALQEWTAESQFPTLKSLVLRRCSNLSEIPDDIGETLELIEVDESRESLVLSATQIKENQQDNGNYALKVHIVRDIKSREFSVLLRMGGRFNQLETSTVYVGGDVYAFKYSNYDDISTEHLKRITGRDDAEDPVEVYAKTRSGFELVGSRSHLVRLCKESLDGDKKVRLYIEGNGNAETVKEEDGGVGRKRVKGTWFCCTGNDETIEQTGSLIGSTKAHF